ncbi:hypothetical protein [Spirillospora sp. NPDC029432]|uniref:hypothetical protein n=1 Tax=Spirillospora sp. NPDC029432 TaxID=3154599 RepID=UPI0034550405
MRRPLRTAAVAVLLALALTGCDMMQRISEGAYRNAVADGTVAELARHGIAMDRRPDCRLDEPLTDATVMVRCTGHTSAGARVAVYGETERAATRRPEESYEIRVDGRAPIRTSCLGVSCGTAR